MLGRKIVGLKSFTPTSKLRFAAASCATALALALALALGLGPAVAHAQLFSDSEAHERLDNQAKRVAILEQSLRQLASQAAKLSSEKQELLQLIRQLSGLIEENSFADQANRKVAEKADLKADKLTAEGDKIQRRIASLEALVNRDANATKLYDQGRLKFIAGEHNNASSDFALLLKLYPTSTLAAPAKYWIGQVHLSSGNAERAAETFQDLLATYPASPRASAALLMLAEAYDLMNSPEAATVVRRELIERYPGSLAADQARKSKL